MNIYWSALLVAGLFEIGWPLGLKITAIPGMKLWGIMLEVVSLPIRWAGVALIILGVVLLKMG